MGIEENDHPQSEANLRGFSTERLLAEVARRGVRYDNFLARLREVNGTRQARYQHGDTGWTAMQWGCAFAGEAGELCNLLKKHDRQLPSDPEQAELIPEIAEEIADSFIYLDLIAWFFDLDLSNIVAAKFNKVSKRLSLPERLEP